jgi:hypothetical protein
VLYKFQKHTQPKPASESQEDAKNYSIEEIAIKVSIEFCLNINEASFLFSDVYDFFRDNGLRDNFINLLCPPIVAGQFRQEYIPEAILEKLVVYLESKSNYKVLEKIIQQLDLTRYSDGNPFSRPDKPQASIQSHVSMRSYLEVLCSTNCMVSALLYLYTSTTNEDAGCKQILEMMHKSICDKKGQEQIERSKNPSLKALTKEDIRMMAS